MFNSKILHTYSFEIHNHLEKEKAIMMYAFFNIYGAKV